MVLFVCAMFDSATQAYGRPIFVNAPGQAMRSFQDEINRPAADNDLNKHPDDFELWHLANYDDTHGTFTSSAPVLLMRGKDAVKPTE